MLVSLPPGSGAVGGWAGSAGAPTLTVNLLFTAGDDSRGQDSAL